MDDVQLHSSSRLIKSNMFQPCDVDEILEYKKPNHYQFKLSGQYQVCDYNGNSMRGKGTPTIWYGKYDGFSDSIYTVPIASFTAFHEFYALLFPQGIKIGYEGKSLSLRESIEAKCKDDTHFSTIMREWMSKNFTHAALDERKEIKKITFETDTPNIVCFRKDKILSSGKILRFPSRPWQVEPGVYAPF